MLNRFLPILGSNSSILADQYQEMHAARAFPGVSWKSHYETLQQCIPALEDLRIVDYGCGPNGGLAEFLPNNVRPYDPYVASYAAPPWNECFDVLFSSDVLEHVPTRDVRPLFAKIAVSAPSYVFLNISTRKAHKRLPNGTNAHLTVKPARWWLETAHSCLGEFYKCIFAREDLLRSEVTLCFERNK
jgi:hypothetical protein